MEILGPLMLFPDASVRSPHAQVEPIPLGVAATDMRSSGLVWKRIARAFPRAALAIFVVMFAATASAQTITADEKGLPSNSAFSGGNVDTVNLQNGNLHISIPIATAAQRGGGTVQYSFVYDTQAWIKRWVAFTCSDAPPCIPPGEYTSGTNTNVVSGWRLSSSLNWGANFTESGLINCPTTNLSYQQVTNWAIIDPQGTKHALPLRGEIGTNSCYGQDFKGPTLDGSGMVYDAKNYILYMKDGTQFNVSNLYVDILNAPDPTTYLVRDTNGNTMTSSSDTIDRNLLTTVNGTNPDGTGYTTYTTQDYAGNPLVFRVDYQLVSTMSDICAATNIGPYGCTDTPGAIGELPSTLTLPTGKQYVFKYAPNTPADLIEMDLPTGAVITYQYEDFYQSNPYLQGQEPGYTGSRAVKQRTVTVGSQTNTWTYTPSLSKDTVTDPLGNVQVHSFGPVSVTGPGGLISSPNVYELGVAYYNSQNQLLRSTSNQYAAEYDPVNNTTANVRMVQTTTTLDNGQISQKQTSYETFQYTCVNTGGACTGTATRLNPIQTSEYDYGASVPGALLRQTNYGYLHTNNQNYINLNIVNRPTTVTVYDGNGNMAAQTVNEYDNYSHTNQPMQASGAIQHDTGYGTSFTTRGNLTAVSRWRNTDGALLTTTNQYDDAGNLLSKIDPLGHQTSYSYADSWANSACVPSGTAAAFRTKVSNALGQSASSTYNACTGTVSATTDPNGNTTSTTYDTFDRTKVVSLPDGGQTTFCYSDDSSGSCYNTSVLSSSETTAMSSAANMVNTTLYDGLGRVQETQLNSDPAGIGYADTQYDGDGRAYKASNPYRTGDTEYWTTKGYDGLGRLTSVANPDGTATGTAYSGNTTTVTDEVGNQRKSVNDALGRLTSVWEAPLSWNYETDYTYDVLGDLLTVNQHGASTATPRTRSFTYNSLAQLLTSTNPETGTVCYGQWSGSNCSGGYDGDGNLLSKTDARGVVATYTYDALNRLTSKSYSDGMTPVSCYQYDASGVTNGIGRLANAWTQPAKTTCTGSQQNGFAPVAGQYLTLRSISVYDKMGRLKNEQQSTPASRASGKTYAPAYTYDLAGNLLTSTDGSTPSPTTPGATLTLTNTLDGAGRLSTVTSNWSDATSHPGTLFSAQAGTATPCPNSTSTPYAAFGALMNATFGIGPAANVYTLNRSFDNRLRTTCEVDTGSGVVP